MVRACVEEGCWACSQKSVGVRSERQEEARTNKEDRGRRKWRRGARALVWRKRTP